VVHCPSCGEENPDRARFCLNCAAPLHPVTPPAEARKTITVLFCDLVGSTALGEELDAETVRRVLSRYYEEMRAALERHGGLVAKFMGDAVMGVFGIPEVHEDDALRAVRAAADMRSALDRLNQELDREQGVQLSIRTGINTGEVVTGDRSSEPELVVGDTVNTAARLEQAARPGEVLFGRTTYRLVRDAVDAEPIEPLILKGKTERVSAFRLRSVAPGAEGVARRLDSPMVGRDRELDALMDLFGGAAQAWACRLATIVGPAGMGKSRLLAEFLARAAGSARVLSGRCLPYGEGMTFWPLGQVVREAAGVAEGDSHDEAQVRIEALLEGIDEGDLIAKGVASLIGLGREQVQQIEGFWAVRRLLEALARREPIVVVIEDIHWAEPTLLDLVEYVAAESRHAPILLACSARPELLDRRPGWGVAGAATIVLEPLREAESDLLIRNLMGASSLPAEVTERVTEAAEGNPLFVEEMFSMLVDEGSLQRANGHWVAVGDLTRVKVPPTIQALLASRLDQLPTDERRVLERASVAGKVFYLGGLAHLSSDQDREGVGVTLRGLVRKDLVRPEDSDLAGEDAYHFRHILIRDAAYAGIPKATRVQLHQAFAEWLETSTGDRVSEYEEILGYHLEQAYRYRAELAPVDETARTVGDQAARWLIAAGRRATDRGDVPARVNLFGRVLELMAAEDPLRPEIMFEYASALPGSGRPDRAEAAFRQAEAAAARVGDQSLEWRSRIEGAWLAAVMRPTETPFAHLLAQAAEAIEVFTRLNDDRGLAEAWEALSKTHYLWSNQGPRLEAAERALKYAERLEDLPLISNNVSHVVFAMAHGATPAGKAVRRSRELLGRFAGRRKIELSILIPLPLSLAMLGRLDEARRTAERAMAIAGDLGARWSVGLAAWMAGQSEHVAGEFAAAEPLYRRAYEIYEGMGEKGQLSTLAVLLGAVLYNQARYDEAFALTQVSVEATSPEDHLSQALWRALRGEVLARRGEFVAAERLTREAVQVIALTDGIDFQGDVLMSLAEVLRLSGRDADAVPVARDALACYERKENLMSAARARAALQELGAAIG
jgi:class 3 adenylate cyclase/tetratricopeptide (TPR) repeat protein